MTSRRGLRLRDINPLFQYWLDLLSDIPGIVFYCRNWGYENLAEHCQRTQDGVAYLFVYGTLRRTERYHQELQRLPVRWIGNGQVYGTLSQEERIPNYFLSPLTQTPLKSQENFIDSSDSVPLAAPCWPRWISLRITSHGTPNAPNTYGNVRR